MQKVVLMLGIALASTNASGAPPTIDLQLVANNLTNLVVIAQPDDGSGRLFLVQQTGQIRILDGTQLLTTNFLNISTLIVAGGERGLLGLTFSPGYSTNGLFFVYYTRSSDGAITIARYSVSANPNIATTNGTVLITIPHAVMSNHNGGNLAFGPDGYLYAGTGDGGGSCDSTGPNAQDLGSLLGKLIRLDVSNVSTTYTIPPTNPFVSTNGARPEIWAYGLRNPWRFSFDRVTGDLFIGDVGQGDREEVDFQIAGSLGGQNYGWNCMEGFLSNTCSGFTCATPAMVRPILDYDHSGSRIAIMGGYRYRGTAIPPLVGTYLYADEKSMGPIYGATQSVAGVWSSVLLTNTPFTMTTFGEDQSGELYVSRYSSGASGGFYRIVWKDTDADGMPDDYESANSFNPTNSIDGAQDADGDGASNVAEFQAGTGPRDAASLLRITATGPAGDDWIVTFNTVSNKFYRVERCDDLVVPAWTTVTNNVVGTGGSIQIFDLGAGILTQRLYRVRLLP